MYMLSQTVLATHNAEMPTCSNGDAPVTKTPLTNIQGEDNRYGCDTAYDGCDHTHAATHATTATATPTATITVELATATQITNANT